ncbi:arsenic transporter [Bacillus songklensis]|uniref:Arsenic transporter n=1 Tax=Bacillus songklensis TaxID=1069116 RepID=A0ABV8B4G8_9BACI
MEPSVLLTITAFLFTMSLIFIRPKGMNEATAAFMGAMIVLISGTVTIDNLIEIGLKVSGAAITIISTIIMAIVLESIGFFRWMSAKLFLFSKGSGIRLFWLTNLLCFFMTLFFNNDGSILITTPILLILLKNLKLKPHHQIPYLLSGALVATASSAPIGVSNIVNLIALKIIDMDLYEHTALMIVPGMAGLSFMSYLLFLYYRKTLPKTLSASKDSYEKINDPYYHPLKASNRAHQTKLMRNVLLFVMAVRLSLFVASFLHISVSLVAVTCSLSLLFWRWIYLKVSPLDILKKTPWHIFVFAVCMYIVIYGLNNIGLTVFLVEQLNPLLAEDLFSATMIMGWLLTFLSNLFNNHPALMIGTITLTEMNLDAPVMKTIYLAMIIGSDIGALLLPIGTLATLIWMHMLHQAKVHVKWSHYLKTTLTIIPITVIFTLIVLYYWVLLVYI